MPIPRVNRRPVRDRRTRLETELGWRAREDFDSGIEKTVRWYLDNEWWWRPLRDQYDGARLGLSAKVPALGSPSPARPGRSSPA